jgi:hypothetical protein
MHIHAAGRSFEWTADWLDLPDPERQARGWAHADIEVTDRGTLLTVDHEDGRLSEFAPDGAHLASYDVGITEAHGICRGFSGRETYFIADTGVKNRPDDAGYYKGELGERGPQVVEVTADGAVLSRMTAPFAEGCEGLPSGPTRVLVDETSLGGTDSLWITDGYGSQFVYRLSPEGDSEVVIRAGADGGPLRCPHAIWIDRRKSEPELYVADREANRIQVFSLDGEFKRVFGGPEVFRKPTAFAMSGDLLVVAELCGRIALLDADDRIAGYAAADDEACSREGWPNSLDDEGRQVRNRHLAEGKVMAPHGVAADQAGTIYATEFLIGGRFVRLTPGL